MDLNAKIHYALLVLLSLFSEGGPLTSASTLAQRLEIPEKFMKNILSQLAAKGLILSVRGPKGGYAFSKNKLEEITLFSVLEAIGEVPSYKPVTKAKGINQFFEEFNQDILDNFKEITLKELA